MELLVAMGMPRKNMLLCDTKGVIYRGRKDGMNQWKSAFAVETKARTLADALKGADAFFGLSAAGHGDARTMVKSMADKPIIFAMANPDPEITPEEVAEVRSDAIVATGRSDYPNQINNVLGFPFIFRGALDVQASTINEAMKIAAAKALAELAREDVPDQVAAAFLGRQVTYGPDYIIPAPFDPRLITHVPLAVAKAAMDTGVARKPIVDMDGYVAQLSGRLDPVAGWLHSIFSQVRNAPKRIIFAEGEQPPIARAANAFHNAGLGQADPDRTPRADQGGLRDGRHRPHRRDRDARHQPGRAAARVCGVPLRAPAAQGLSAARLPAPREQRPQRVTPPAWWPWATPTAWSRASRATGTRPTRTCARCWTPGPAGA